MKVAVVYFPVEFSTSGFWKIDKTLCEISMTTSGKKAYIIFDSS